jgi:NAD(P)-dependent dehydrogenase (short-subunit alcohol dehydrogenase family)
MMMKPLVDIENLRLLVIGANSGIGHRIAMVAHEAGARLAVTRFPALEFDDLPASFPVFECDVTDPHSVSVAVTDAEAALGGLDAIILTAGIFDHRAIDETDDAAWRRVMSINIDGPFHVARAAHPIFKRAGGGSLVLFSSQIGIVGHKRATAYAASKAAVNGLARTLAVEFSGFGGRVNAVAPGTIETPMTAVARADAERRGNLLAAVPLKRFGAADEVARSALFLASAAAGYITGHVLVVDGGVTAI